MSAALEAARTALGDAPAWVVGGAVRDRMLGREVTDVDLALDGDVKAAARRLALSAGGPSFALSDAYGAWRVIGPGRAWSVDLVPVQGGAIEADLLQRDFTVNAMAEPLLGGGLVDPAGGVEDLAERRLRMVGEQAFASDPLRTVRLARLACELDLTPDPATVAAARTHAAGLRATAPERVLAELKRIVMADEALDGLELLEAAGATAVVLPELDALHGVRQNRFHHLDVYDHTLATLQAAIDLEADPAALLGPEHAEAVSELLAEELADDLTRAGGLRLGALLHDIAKPQTQLAQPDGTVLGFPGHGEQGADLSRAILTRLKGSERLRAHVAELARHHLAPGFLVKHRPLAPRTVHGYLTATDPVGADVLLLSVCDRVATRGEKAAPAIERHLELARELLGPALAWRSRDRTPLVRGDALAGALDMAAGPELGELLAAIELARYAGELTTPQEAVAFAARRRTTASQSETASPTDA